MLRILCPGSRINWKYILGELFLIALGIMIALQINNWNEGRKAKIRKQKILREIKGALELDYEHQILNRQERIRKIQDALDQVLKQFSKEETFPDSLGDELWQMAWSVNFEPNTFAFESLGGKGLELIKDEKLRQTLVYLYDFAYPNLQFFTKSFNEWSKDRVEPFMLNNFEYQSKGRRKAYIPLDYKKIRKSLFFSNILRKRQDYLIDLNSRYERAGKHIQRIIQQIEKSIE
ncbi:MAG: DUF6090 family protein [Bacteroidota bacterium]